MKANLSYRMAFAALLCVPCTLYAQPADLPPQPALADDAEAPVSETETVTDGVEPLPAESPEQPVAANISLPQFTVSLMFAEEDILNLEQVITNFYGTAKQQRPQRASNQGPSDEDLLAELLRQAENKEAQDIVLPDFFLSSFIYRNPSDWSIWLQANNLNVAPPNPATDFDQQLPLTGLSPTNAVQRININAGKPQDEPSAMSVIDINDEMVRLAWKPQNVSIAFGRYQSEVEDAKEGEEKEINRHEHRLARVAQSAIEYDVDKDQFVILMRVNQTFAADSMRIYEGKRWTKPRQMEPAFAGEGQGFGAPGSGAPGRNAGLSMERSLSNQLIDNLRQVQQFVPVTPNR